MKYQICLINLNPEFDLDKLLFLLQDFQVKQYLDLDTFLIDKTISQRKTLLVLIGTDEKQILELKVDLKEHKNLIISHFTEINNLYDLILAGCNAFVEIDKLEEFLFLALKRLNEDLFFVAPHLMSKTIKFFQDAQRQKKEKLQSLLNECEYEIVKLIAEGKTDFEIKQYLNLLNDNYTNLLNNIKSKLNVKSRSEIAILVLKNNF